MAARRIHISSIRTAWLAGALALVVGLPLGAATPPCIGDQDCARRGEALAAAGDYAGALAAWEYGCVPDIQVATFAMGSASCTALALRYAEAPPPDAVRTRAVLRMGCSGTVALYDVCARLAGMAARGEGGPIDPALAANAAASGCTRRGAERPLRDLRAEACRILGEAARTGHGYPQHDAIATGAFADACALGLEAACREVPAWSFALSPDGRWLAGYDRISRPPRVWSTSTGELLFQHDAMVEAVVWSPDSSEVRLVGLHDFRATPRQSPSFLVRAADWTAHPAALQVPNVGGWLADGRLLWIDPEGQRWKATKPNGRQATLWAAPTYAIACDHALCIAPIQRRGLDQSLVLATGRQPRWAPPFYQWIPGSYLARIDSHEAFDLRTWHRLPIAGPMQDANQYRGLFAGAAGAWTLQGDRVVAFDPATFTPRSEGMHVRGLDRCGPVHTNPAICAWNGSRGLLVVQHGDALQVADLPAGTLITSIEAR